MENAEKCDSNTSFKKSDYKFSGLVLKSIACTHLYSLRNICSDQDGESEKEFQTQSDRMISIQNPCPTGAAPKAQTSPTLSDALNMLFIFHAI